LTSAPLWSCPRCGAKRFVELIAACGPYDVAPAKTRVAFLAQATCG
jgi:hypothetical protein